MNMNLVADMLTIVAGALCILTPLFIVSRYRRQQQMKTWTLTKIEKAQNGWRPSLYEPDATDEEKVAAILAYAEGKPIPEQKRLMLPSGQKK